MSAFESRGVAAMPKAQAVAETLRGLLPASAEVALSWRDWVIGADSAASAGAPASLRRRADQALWETAPDEPDPCLLVHSHSSQEGNARLAVAALLPAPLPPHQRQAWVATADLLAGTALEAARAQARVELLEKSKRLQQALFAIADLAGADLELAEMLRRVHAVIGSLMYAQNCYIVQYDDVRRTMRFLYFADQRDPYRADPLVEIPEAELDSSMTLALLRHGQPLRGPSSLVRQRLGVPRDPSHGPDSLDWLGVPMRREERMCGAIVVQSYDVPASYTDEDRALLSYVAQHILTALDRRQAHAQLESRIAERTAELRLANRELQAEIIERRRAEKLQNALFRITEMAITSDSLERFYADVHGVVDELIVARNFYIALLDEDGEQLHFPYSIDERDPMRQSRRIANGLTEYVIRTGQPLLAGRERIGELRDQGEVIQHGPPAYSWLGVPLRQGRRVVGCLVVQSYSNQVRFTPHDQNLLSFVAHHIGNGLTRQRTRENLRAAHAELERRVDERTFELAETNARLMAQMGERLRAEQALTFQATHDALTDLPNRSLLLERLARSITAARAGGSPFAVMFMDLDRFKLVNDSMGHAAGDEMLVEVSRRITSVMGEQDTVARLGGDEFAVVLHYDGSPQTLADSAQKLLALINLPMWVGGRELYPAASIGIAAWHPRYARGEEMLRDADAAMYRAKAGGRDRSALFDEAMREAAVRSLDLEGELRRAINRREFLVHYQPIARMDDGVVIGHEALLRWRHPVRGLLTPGEFITLGEESGLIEQVDWLLYDQVVQHIARGVEGYVSVNVSPLHFRSPDFADRLLAMFEAVGADAGRLRVEITEVALLDDGPRTLRILRTLRQHGVLAQLDDFGTGFSGLSYLHKFPISALKIDRSFISGIGSEARPESLGLVRAILALAVTLGIETIAEGVETRLQYGTLRGLGCNYAQGFLIGPPLPDAAGSAPPAETDGAPAAG